MTVFPEYKSRIDAPLAGKHPFGEVGTKQRLDKRFYSNFGYKTFAEVTTDGLVICTSIRGAAQIILTVVFLVFFIASLADRTLNTIFVLAAGLAFWTGCSLLGKIQHKYYVSQASLSNIQ